jgi:hypothetical protein
VEVTGPAGKAKVWRLFAYQSDDDTQDDWTCVCDETTLPHRLMRWAESKDTILVTRVDPDEVGWQSFRSNVVPLRSSRGRTDPEGSVA